MIASAVGLKAQTLTIDTSYSWSMGSILKVGDKPFEKYYDTVKVLMLVSEKEPLSVAYTLIGFEVYSNYFVPLHWEEGDRQVDSHTARDLIDRYYYLKGEKQDCESIIIWQTRVFK